MTSSLYTSPFLPSLQEQREVNQTILHSAPCIWVINSDPLSVPPLTLPPCLHHTPVVALIEQRGCLSRSDCHPRGCVWRHLGWKTGRNQLLLRIGLTFQVVHLSAFGWALCWCMCETNWTSTLWSISSELPICILRLFILGLSPPLCLYKEVYACVYVCDCLPTGSSVLMIALAISLWGSPPMTNSHIRYQPPLFHKINSLSSVFSAYIGWYCCSCLFTACTWCYGYLWAPAAVAAKHTDAICRMLKHTPLCRKVFYWLQIQHLYSKSGNILFLFSKGTQFFFFCRLKICKQPWGNSAMRGRGSRPYSYRSRHKSPISEH